ncbi:MAG: hypothetical protein A3H91_10720 [Gammaproteobacteria bacterium RIFCSPLOWO2_02_FULL_61_13]|nr:MAG: hypothetical protein A3H91_10720 [Gammaproteobacteria bacterium RIFCSPLOWO2_02_FULL_61_13]
MMAKPATNPANGHPELPPLLQRAVAAHQDGKLDVAYPLYRSFVDQNPAHPTALQLLGLLHSQRGEYAVAIELMRESLRQFPQQPEVANNLGNALSSAGMLKEAVDSYAQAIRLYPRYQDAFRNLGLGYLQLGIVDDAKVCFQRCIDMNRADAAAWLGLGNVYKRQNDVDQALRCFEEALALRPDYAEAHHNLGVCLRMKQRTAEAIGHFESARRLGLDRAELYQNLGSALVDSREIGAAIKAYQDAVERNPEDAIAHRDLNKLLWEQELLDDYLDSYRKVLDQRPGSVQLRLDYAMALNQKEAFEDAERVVMQGLRQLPDSIELKSMLAYTLEGQKRWTDALQMHSSAVRMPGASPQHHVSYARALLACQRPDEALVQAKIGAGQMPFNQRAIAYLGLCWRMLSDERDAIINDYQEFVRTYELPVPVRFANSTEFNAQLARILESRHVAKRHPPEQTLRGGTQTHGDLFDDREPEIQELVAGLKECVRDYAARLPLDTSHPLLARRSSSVKFSASWSVRLWPCGYHTMHVHPLGWLSSAYYVQVPSEITDSDANGGGIKFGEPDIEIGTQGAARRIIQPQVGRLILFPSYMWHGTVPFDSGTSRMTVAFDVVPAGE